MGRILRATSLALGVLTLTLGGVEEAVAGSLAADLEIPEPPHAVIERFDSLLTVGTPDAVQEAKTLTVGTARRLFPLLAETQAKLNSVLDTARSRDTVLDEKVSGDGVDQWAAVKLKVDVVFKKPFMGMTELSSVQMIHLHRSLGSSASAGWKIADFEELADANVPAVPRSGAVQGQERERDVTNVVPELLPLSPLAPATEDQARVTGLRLRISRRDGASLASLPVGPGQRIISTQAGEAAPLAPSVTLETMRPRIRDSLATGRSAPWHDSLAVYLASTTELDLTDKTLGTRAAKLKQGSPHDVETARRIWRFVSTSFDYKLGTTLFATSREALRDMKGDCSEAAVLTAALLRAAGIPSRVVFGYATLGQGVWIGHAWTEAWLGDKQGGWIGVDAALREFPTGPYRVALVTLSGQEDMKAVATNLMLSTISNLDIEILGAWAGESEIPLVEYPAARAEAGKFWEQVLEGMGQ